MVPSSLAQIVLYTKNLTELLIEVPQGATQHANPRLLCLPIWWLDIVVFFSTNYIAHAFTVRNPRGGSKFAMVSNGLLAILFPFSALMRALNALRREGRGGGTPLEKACRAGALCMVVRGPDWLPIVGQNMNVRLVKGMTGTEVYNDSSEAKITTFNPTWARENVDRWLYFDTIWSRSTVNTEQTNIHGSYYLPTGYCFQIMPRNTILKPFDGLVKIYGTARKVDICCNNNWTTPLASIVQLYASSTTLFTHRPDLTQRWGYASFHLTVIPYLFMTVINLITAMRCPDFPYLYMVHTDIMDEAIAAGGSFAGIVAQTVPVHAPSNSGYGHGLDWPGITSATIKYFMKRLYEPWLRRSNEYGYEDKLTAEGSSENPESVSVLCNPRGRKYRIRHEEEAHETPDVNLTKQLGAIVTKIDDDLWSGYECVSQAFDDDNLYLRSSAVRILLASILCWNALKNRFNPQQESPIPQPRQITIYYANCTRFLREDDMGVDKHQLSTALRTSLNSLWQPGSESVFLYDDRKETKPTWWTVLFQYGIGILLSCLLLAIYGYFSDWFHPGQSSATECVIMMIWLANGILTGLGLPLLSTMELVKICLLAPLYRVFARVSVTSLLGLGFAYHFFPYYHGAIAAIGFVPLGIFVAPIWGFVLVGKMLAEWGKCETLW